MDELNWIAGGLAVTSAIFALAAWCAKGQEPGFEPKKMSEVARNLVQMIAFFAVCLLLAHLVPATRLFVGLSIAGAMTYFCFKHDHLEAERQKRSDG